MGRAGAFSGVFTSSLLSLLPLLDARGREGWENGGGDSSRCSPSRSRTNRLSR
uniref:EC69 protein n=1 Tax=Colletotrichum higginsianum TaxID=80884 RepID=I2G7E9_9PEZI|nr:EC69 protein [Colletotrichum higginsianum]